MGMSEYKDITELKKQIADFKKAVHSPNGDYLTGYVCALSATEGIIAGLPDADVVEVVRCKKCINGIYDESNNIYKCVKSTNYDPEYNDWFGFVSYHNADYYCADGERRTDG